MSSYEKFHYKNYIGSLEFSEADSLFHGRIMGITPFISYEGGSIDDVTEDFHNAVDEYLEFCVDTGKKPEISNPNTAPTAIF